MSEKKLRLDLEVATKEAQSNLKDAAKEAKKLGNEIDDTRSAGKKFADAMNKVTDDFQDELRKSEKAAERLADALGPEMVQALSAQGKKVGDLVQDLKRAGLAYEDVEQDAEALAAAIKRANDVGEQVSTHVTKPVEDLGREADNSRSVLANMVGNTTQDLGELGGVAGTAGVAIGQLAEYAADGNIKLKNLAAVAGPMLALGVATKIVGDHFAKQAKLTAAMKEGTKQLATTLREAGKNGVDAAKAIGNAWADTGEIQVRILDDMVNVTPILSTLGVTAEQFANITMQGKDKIDAWGQAMLDAGMNSQDVAIALQAATYQHKVYGKALEQNAILEKVFGDEVSRTVPVVGKLHSNLYKVNNELNRLMGMLDEQDAWDNIQAQIGALMDGEGDVQQETRDLTRSLADMVMQLDEIPPQKKTELLMKLQQGDLQAVYNAIADIEKRSPTIRVGVRYDDPGFHYVPGSKKVGARAKGGPVTAGQPYIVGEQGPELMVPGSSGTVVPNDKLGTGYVDNRTINISINNQSPEDTANAIIRKTRRNGS